ncbi:MAG TPA: hypothetical protein DCG57_02580 [Candidatus Riflebacteria bacterium]|jgi:hypothetical protein|nr:hypothetical protein [Candidatus Riflebacteria bacterium]
MKSERAGFLILTMFLISGMQQTSAQMPNFFAPPPTPAPVARPVASPAPAPVTEPVKTPASEPGQPLPYKESVYDPAMDNHLKAPSQDQQVGLFGLPISRVENMLMANGAKKHSYAFGKYSRLTLSVYLVTVYFDRDRLVGAFSVEPRPPYKTVEPDARQFFMEMFLKDADLSRFEANIASSRLEVKYKN